METTQARPTEAEVAVLEALAAQGEILSARDTSGATPFRARLRFVDPARQYLVVARSGDPVADAAFLALEQAELFVEWGEWRIAFAAAGPTAVSHEGVAAIRLRFPESVATSRRRMFERAPVPTARFAAWPIPTPCRSSTRSSRTSARAGSACQIDPLGDALDPGMVLPRCRIARGGGEPTTVDLEVRHTTTSPAPMAAGRCAPGCRFVNLSPSAMALVAEFVGTR